MLIIPTLTTSIIPKIQSYTKLSLGRVVINNHLPKCRIIRNYTKLRTIEVRTNPPLNTRKAVNGYTFSTIAVLGVATLSAKVLQVMREVECDAPKNPFKTGNDSQDVIRKSLTGLAVAGVIAAINWITWGIMSNPVLGFIVIFAVAYYEIDRQEKEKLTIRIKL